MGGFAKEGRIPWHYKEDFIHFKNTTMGNACVMGRNTYNEINEFLGEAALKSVLPGRTCYVISTTLIELPNATVIKSLDEITSDVFVIGGAQLYEAALQVASTVYLTIINKNFSCDVFFDVQYVQEHFTSTTESVQLCEDVILNIYYRSDI
jgi:dihydrofolate reductase